MTVTTVSSGGPAVGDADIEMTCLETAGDGHGEGSMEVDLDGGAQHGGQQGGGNAHGDGQTGGEAAGSAAAGRADTSTDNTVVAGAGRPGIPQGILAYRNRNSARRQQRSATATAVNAAKAAEKKDPAGTAYVKPDADHHMVLRGDVRRVDLACTPERSTPATPASAARTTLGLRSDPVARREAKQAQRDVARANAAAYASADARYREYAERTRVQLARDCEALEAALASAEAELEAARRTRD